VMRFCRVARRLAADAQSLRTLAGVHVLYLAACERVIHFYRTAFVATDLRERSVLHSFADTVKHEPCRLLRNTDRAVEFVAGDAVLAVANHPNCRHPLVQPNRGILKDGSDLDCELLLAAIAEPEFPRLHKRIAFRTATGAGNLLIRPAQELRVVKSAVRVGEVSDCPLERYGLFHFSHLLSIRKVPLSILCAKYIITAFIYGPLWLSADVRDKAGGAVAVL
jgi:hypothetical protein